VLRFCRCSLLALKWLRVLLPPLLRLCAVGCCAAAAARSAAVVVLAAATDDDHVLLHCFTSLDVSQCLAMSRNVSRDVSDVSQCLVSLFVRVCPLFDKYPRASVEFLGPADFREISEPHDSIPAISREKMIPAKNISNPRFLQLLKRSSVRFVSSLLTSKEVLRSQLTLLFNRSYP
jgi:hypothetical protein